MLPKASSSSPSHFLSACLPDPWPSQMVVDLLGDLSDPQQQSRQPGCIGLSGCLSLFSPQSSILNDSSLIKFSFSLPIVSSDTEAPAAGARPEEHLRTILEPDRAGAGLQYKQPPAKHSRPASVCPAPEHDTANAFGHALEIVHRPASGIDAQHALQPNAAGIRACFADFQ